MNTKEIKEIAKIVRENGIESMEIISNDVTIKIKMPTTEILQSSVLPITTNKTDPNEIREIIDHNLDFNDLKLITSPMVGVFYAAPSPDSEPFIKIGDKIKKGDVLCIIEAMKLMNEITAEHDGEIIDICVENGQVVEFSQTLFKTL